MAVPQLVKWASVTTGITTSLRLSLLFSPFAPSTAVAACPSLARALGPQICWTKSELPSEIKQVPLGCQVNEQIVRRPVNFRSINLSVTGRVVVKGEDAARRRVGEVHGEAVGGEADAVGAAELVVKDLLRRGSGWISRRCCRSCSRSCCRHEWDRYYQEATRQTRSYLHPPVRGEAPDLSAILAVGVDRAEAV